MWKGWKTLSVISECVLWMGNLMTTYDQPREGACLRSAELYLTRVPVWNHGKSNTSGTAAQRSLHFKVIQIACTLWLFPGKPHIWYIYTSGSL